MYRKVIQKCARKLVSFLRSWIWRVLEKLEIHMPEKLIFRTSNFKLFNNPDEVGIFTIWTYFRSPVFIRRRKMSTLRKGGTRKWSRKWPRNGSPLGRPDARKHKETHGFGSFSAIGSCFRLEKSIRAGRNIQIRPVKSIFQSLEVNFCNVFVAMYGQAKHVVDHMFSHLMTLRRVRLAADMPCPYASATCIFTSEKHVKM